MFHKIQVFSQFLFQTNRRKFPDKHRMTNMLLKNVRDRNLQTFIGDSVRECFNFVEANHTKDKCEFSRNLGSCLAARGHANCDDWDDKEVLF